MEREIDSAVKRGRAYWFVDGFAEMGAGVFLALLGAVTLIRGIAVPAGMLPWLAATALDIGTLKAVMLLAFIFGVWWLRDRFTYPRTGYVRGGGVPRGVILVVVRNIFLIAALPLLLLIGVLLLVPAARIILPALAAWLPLGIGILFGAFCYLAGEWMGLRRFRLLGFFILLAGIAVAGGQSALDYPALSQDSPPAQIISRMFSGVGWMVSVSGIGFLVSGLTTFLRYRKENPKPSREEP